MRRRLDTTPDTASDPVNDPAAPSAYRIQAMVDGLDELALAMERTWGVDRLRLAVSDFLRAKFDEQKDRLDATLAAIRALADSDREQRLARGAKPSQLVYRVVCVDEDTRRWPECDLGNFRVALNALVRVFRC